MVGIKVEGDLDAGRRRARRARRGRLRGRHRRLLRPAGRDRLRGRRPPAGDDQQAHPLAPRRALAPRASSTSSSASRPTPGEPDDAHCSRPTRRPARKSGRTTTCGCTSPACRRYDDAPVPTIVRGEGAYIYDDRGKRYLDGLSGLFVVQAGHGRARAGRGRRTSRRRSWPSSRSGATRTRKAIELAERLAELRARRPEQGLLHHRRRRGGRDRLEAGQAVLQAHRQAARSTRSSRARSPTTAPRRARCPSPGCRR